MAEIEDLQVELESIICVQKLGRLIDLAKYFQLEIDPEVKTKLTVIQLLRKHIEETIANEPGTSPHKQFLKDAVSFMTGEPPPLEHAEEIAKLQKQYDELKTKSELELSDVKQKLDALQGPTALKAKCNELTHETEATVKQADEGKVHSTLYTSIPHDLLKSRMNNIINNAFKHKNGATRYTHIKVGRNKSHFTSDPLNGDNKYTANDICKMIEFLVDNIYVRFGGQLFRQMVSIGLWADLFLYSYENEFLDKLIKEGKRKLARRFNLSYRYIDDLISFNNKRFKEFISDIYPKELTISETTESTSVASYLDLLFTRDRSNNITTKLYDKRDAFGFHIVNFPFMSSNIPSAPAYGVYASQLVRYARCCSNYSDFLIRHRALVKRLL